MGRTPPPDLVITDVREEDIPEITAIERASFATPWNEILFFNELKKDVSLFRVARFHESIVGYLCVHLVLDEADVMTFAVSREYRGQGIASALFQDMLKLLAGRGCTRIHLEVRESNHEARQMYEHFGFEHTATRKGYYAKPVEDGIVMQREVSENRD